MILLKKIILTVLVLSLFFGLIFAVVAFLTKDKDINQALIIEAFNEGKTLSCGYSYKINNKDYEFNGKEFFKLSKEDYKIIKVKPFQCSIEMKSIK